MVWHFRKKLLASRFPFESGLDTSEAGGIRSLTKFMEHFVLKERAGKRSHFNTFGGELDQELNISKLIGLWNGSRYQLQSFTLVSVSLFKT